MTQGGVNAPSIDFYFDFASPYAWLATGQLKKLAAEFGLRLVWRPILLWVVFRQQQILPPLESPKRKAYMLHDMERSARFYGVDYCLPQTFPVNSSIAAKAWRRW